MSLEPLPSYNGEPLLPLTSVHDSVSLKVEVTSQIFNIDMPEPWLQTRKINKS